MKRKQDIRNRDKPCLVSGCAHINANIPGDVLHIDDADWWSYRSYLLVMMSKVHFPTKLSSPYRWVVPQSLNLPFARPGGRQGKMPVTALEAFDLETKSWTRYSCIPSRRAFSCCATNERSLFSLGGLQQPGPHNFYSRPHFVSTMEEYDLDQGKLPLQYSLPTQDSNPELWWGGGSLLWMGVRVLSLPLMVPNIQQDWLYSQQYALYIE